MATIFGSNGNNTLIVESDSLRGLGGDDTYIVTNAQSNTAGSPPGVVTIVDTEGNNRLQLADGLQISRVDVLGGNAVQLTLSNNQRIQLLGADRFTFDVGGNTVAGDAEGLTGRTFAQFVNDFGIALTNGAGSTAGPVTVQPGAMPLGVPPPPPALPVISIPGFATPQFEGDSGVSVHAFTLRREGDTRGTSTVQYTVTGTGNNPANASDFAGGVFPTGTATFAPGETTAVVLVNVLGDTVLEANETFTIALSAPNGAMLGQPSSATAFINNDDAAAPPPPPPSNQPVISISSFFAPPFEGDTGITLYSFVLTREGDTSGTSTVAYRVTGVGTNPADLSDFARAMLPSGTVTFAAGQTAQVVNINVQGDILVEADEAFAFTLSTPSGATLGQAFSATVMVNNDDSPAPPSSQPVVSVAGFATPFFEGNSGTSVHSFTVTREGDISGTSTVQYTVSGTGANPVDASDFLNGVIPSGTLTFAPGQSAQTVRVDVRGDTQLEADETFAFTLSAPSGATLGHPSSVTAFVNDDDTSTQPPPPPPPPQSPPVVELARVQYSGNEGNSGFSPYTATFTRSGDTSATSIFEYELFGLGHHPVSGSDFVGGALPSGTVTFGVGQTEQSFTIAIRGDTLPEAEESFFIVVRNSVNANTSLLTVGSTILNDDDPAPVEPTGLPVATIASAFTSAPEGNSGSSAFSFVISLTGDTSRASSVDYTVTGIGSNAVNGADFVGGVVPSGTVNFAPGQTSQTVVLNVAPDTMPEMDEQLIVFLNGASGVTIDSWPIIFQTVRNDDGITVADDFSDNTGTTGRVTVGGTASGVLEALADRDWFAVDLVAGQSYRVNLSAAGGSSLDTFLRVLNSAGVQLAFDDDSGTGFNSELVFSASETGRYFIEAGAFNGNTTGAYTVSVVTAPSPPPPPPNDTSRFNIALDYTGPAQYRPFFEQAAARLEQVIVGDLASSTYNGVFVDDVLISSVVQNIDGPGNVLGQAGPDRFRMGNQPLPVHGVMEFDSADADALIAEGGFGLVVLHEMLHVLGFGTLWNDYGFNTTFGQYAGARALQEYRAARDPGAAFVPLETGGGGGSANSHWADGLFFGEVMGAFYTRGEAGALSRITAGALEDLGYTVNYNAADPFSFNPRLVAQTPDGDPGVQGILIAQPPKPMVWMPETA